MSTIWNWNDFFGPAQQAIKDYASRQQYQGVLDSMLGQQQQMNPVQITPAVSGVATTGGYPGASPLGRQMAAAATPLSDPSRIVMDTANQNSANFGNYGGPLGQMLGPQAAPLIAAMKGLPPSMGIPLLMQTAQSGIQRQQNIADKKITPISDAEAATLGLRPGGLYGRDVSNNIVTIQPSDMKSQGAYDQALQAEKDKNALPATPYQSASLKQQVAELAEKKREFDANNPMLAQGGGAGPSTDLNSYPAATKGIVQAMLDGRQAPPSSFALSKPYWQNLLAIANTIDPGFDQTTWGARAAMRKNMTGSGKDQQLLNAGNTAINHLGHLNDQINNVSGVGIPLVGDPINAAVNYATNPLTGGTNTYNDTLGHLSEETTKFYRGTGGNEADVQRNMANLSPNLSTTAKKAGVKNTVNLIYGALAPKVEQYNETMGTHLPVSHFLSQQAIATMKKMGFDPDTGEPVDTKAASSAGALQTKTLGGKTYHLVNGQWMQE